MLPSFIEVVVLFLARKMGTYCRCFGPLLINVLISRANLKRSQRSLGQGPNDSNNINISLNKLLSYIFNSEKYRTCRVFDSDFFVTFWSYLHKAHKMNNLCGNIFHIDDQEKDTETKTILVFIGTDVNDLT